MLSYTALLVSLPLLSLLTPVFAITENDVSTCTQKPRNPAPKGFICGARGTLKTPKVYKTFTVGSTQDYVNTCRNTCFDYGNVCRAFSINTTNGLCKLLTAGIAGQGFKKSMSSGLPRFFDKECFQQTCETVDKFILTDENQYQDDQSYLVYLPWPVEFYGQQWTAVYVSVNGFISFGGGLSAAPASSYANTALPNFSGPSAGAAYLPGESLAVFWDDLTVADVGARFCFPDQEVSYSIYPPPYQRIRFTWKARVVAPADGYVEAYVEWDRDNAGIFQIRYPNVDASAGGTATVGAQSQMANQAVTYSYNQNKIGSGTCLNIFTNSNIADDYNC